MLLVRRNIHIAAPDELLVITGRWRVIRDQESGEQRVVGHRRVAGGSAFRVPVIERVDRMSLAEMPIRLTIPNVIDREGRAWRISVLVNARIDSGQRVERAIERFLGMSLDEIQTVVENTVEARVRNVLVVHDLADPDIWTGFERSLSDVIRDDAERLGIQIDNLIFEESPRPGQAGMPENGSARANELG